MPARERLSREMSNKLDLMIASGRYSTEEMVKETGAKPENVNKRIYRRTKVRGQLRQARPSRIIHLSGQPGQLQGQPCPIDVMDELTVMLGKLKEFEDALGAAIAHNKDVDPASFPSYLAVLSEQRKTLETVLKAKVVFSNIPGGGGGQALPVQQLEDRIPALMKVLRRRLAPEVVGEILSEWENEVLGGK